MNRVASYHKAFGHLIPDFGATANVYAPGTVNAGGTAGAMVQVGTAVPMVIVPFGADSPLGLPQTILAAPAIGGGRALYWGFDYGTAAIGQGCELRTASATYQVETVSDWRLARVSLLSQVALNTHA